MASRELVAFNTALESDNKIHDDDVARRFGFTGGLVPGVDVYAYLAWGPAQRWGREWLERGVMQARFRMPAYDGETVTTDFDETTGRLALLNQRGVEVADGSASLPAVAAEAPDSGRFPWAPLPAQRPPASPAALPNAMVLGSWDVGFHADKALDYLRDVREVLPIYNELAVAHPGWVLRLANIILASNVQLGPWIHVGSTVTHHGLIGDGARVSCRGTVTREYEHKGHRFVQLDLGVFADAVLAAVIDHTAIYLPRQVAEAGE